LNLVDIQTIAEITGDIFRMWVVARYHRIYRRIFDC